MTDFRRSKATALRTPLGHCHPRRHRRDEQFFGIRKVSRHRTIVVTSWWRPTMLEIPPKKKSHDCAKQWKRNRGLPLSIPSQSWRPPMTQNWKQCCCLCSRSFCYRCKGFYLGCFEEWRRLSLSRENFHSAGCQNRQGLFLPFRTPRSRLS